MPDASCSTRSSARARCPPTWSAASSSLQKATRSSSKSSIRSLVDAGAVTHDEDGWRFVHDVPLEVPPTVEKVILARIDRLDAGARDALVAASVLGRQFGLPAPRGGGGGTGGCRSAVPAGPHAAGPGPGGPALARARVPVQARADPGGRVPHAGDRRPQPPAPRGRRPGWRRATRAERRRSPACWPTTGWRADDEDKAVTYLTIAGDRARQEYALDEAIGHYRELLPILERRGEDREIALVLFKLALALHMSLRFKEANETYQRAFPFWTPPEPFPGEPTATVRVATSYRPRVTDPRAAIAWPDIQLCMQLFDRLVEQWPERTIVPSLADRWEIADDGLRYVFHLRDGLEWSDGTPLTAGDIEFGIKRVLDPVTPGSSVAIYFVLENGQDYYLGRNEDADRVGVTALDDRTVEFRLVAPAPYFMSVMNRPDGGPQPRHAIEADGCVLDRRGSAGRERRVPDRRADGRSARARTAAERRRIAGRQHPARRVRPLVGGRRRRPATSVAISTSGRSATRRGSRTWCPPFAPTHTLGPAAWSGYFGFDLAHPVLSNVDFRRALAHAVDRETLERCVPDNVVVADRRRRPARAPGPHAGHRPAVRSGQGARATSRRAASANGA